MSSCATLPRVVPYDPCSRDDALNTAETRAGIKYADIELDRAEDGGNVLTTPVLSVLPKHDGPKVIYGTACRPAAARLRQEGIVFKQLPYKLKVDAR